MSDKEVYPNVICDHHPDQIEPGYLICNHITKREDVAYTEVASRENLGVLACSSCVEKMDDKQYCMANFTLCCAPGLRERQWLPTIH